MISLLSLKIYLRDLFLRSVFCEEFTFCGNITFKTFSTKLFFRCEKLGSNEHLSQKLTLIKAGRKGRLNEV